MNIQVLWVDDEYKEDFISFAEQEGIDIHYQQSAVGGKDELIRNYNAYHAVILDAKGILNPQDQHTDLKGLRVIRDHLTQVNTEHYLPYFIFTGQPGYQNSQDFRDSYGDFFTKGKDEQRIVDAIKDAVLKKEEYIVHQKYSKVFQSVKKLIDIETHNYLTDLLMLIHRQDNSFDDSLHFTKIRIILESLFRVANRAGLLHDKCISRGKVNLSESSLFLAGLDTRYAEVKNEKPHFPQLIANSVKDIIFIAGTASHTEDDQAVDSINLQEYRMQVSTPYLLFKLTFQLLDIIIWFDYYLNANPDYAKNVAQWQDLIPNDSTSMLSGVVSRIADNGYGTFTPDNGQKTISIIPAMIREFNLTVDQYITVETEMNETKTLIKKITV